MRKSYILMILSLILTCVSCGSKDSYPDGNELVYAEHILWKNQFNTCDSLLQTIDTTSLNETEKMIWMLLKEHILLEELGSNLSHSNLFVIIPYFEGINALWYAGHAHFLQGKEHLLHNNTIQSMEHFQKAEEYLLREDSIPNRIMYNLYHQMAICANIELNEEANYHYCEQMIPYAQKDSNYYALSVAYQSMASSLNKQSITTNQPELTQLAISLFDSSLYYSRLIEISNDELSYTEDNAVVDILQNEDISTILDGNTVVQEQSINSAEETDKVQLSILLISIIEGVVIILLIWFISRINTRHKEQGVQTEYSNREHYIAYLQKELLLKRENMFHTLLHRSELIKKFKEEYIKQTDKEDIVLSELPDWAQNILEEFLLSNDENSKILQEDFNKMYYNMLVSLKEDYPRLTKADLLMCVFITLHLSITDTCILMSVPKQTVWNRRNRIKEHIGLNESDVLEDFFDKYAFKVFETEYNRSIQEQENNKAD